MQYNFGVHMVDSVRLDKIQTDYLFLTLMLTLVVTFLCGNLLLLDNAIFKSSLSVAVTCLGILLIFYLFAILTSNILMGMLISFIFLLLVAYTHSVILKSIWFIVAMASAVYAVVYLRVDKKNIFPVLIVSIVSTCFIFGGRLYFTFFDMLIRLDNNAVHIDTLFHASIASMLKNYGIVSTGVHGLIETPYHAFSHWLIAGISVLSGQGVLEIYGIVPHILLLPLLIFSIVICSVSLNKNQRINIIFLWSVVCLFLALVPYFFATASFWNNFAVCESFTLALSIFSVSCIYLFKRHINFVDVSCLICSVAIMTYSKGPVGLVFVGLWILRTIFFRGKNIVLEIIAICLFLITIYYVVFDAVSHAVQATPDISFGITNFIQHYSGVQSVHGFFIMHFSTSILSVMYIIRKYGWRFWYKIPSVVYSLGAVGAGTFFLFFVIMPPASAVYFSHVALFVSLPILAIICLHWYEHFFRRYNVKRNLQTPLILALIFTVVFFQSYSSIREKWKVHNKFTKTRSDFVEILLRVRNETDVNTYLTGSEYFIESNPFTERLDGRPFVFPAVSERPWVGVICSLPPQLKKPFVVYKYYGYICYGITDEHQSVTISPVLMRKMKHLSVL